MNDIVDIKHYLDEDGKIKILPKKSKPRLEVLTYLSLKFNKGVIYSESEVNEIIKNWHTFGDWALLRRELFEAKLLDRKKDCSEYWLK